jgi:hypothetical protein
VLNRQTRTRNLDDVLAMSRRKPSRRKSPPRPKPVAPAAPVAPADQRRHDRYLCINGGSLRLCVRPTFRGQRAVLLDVSAGGIGFLLEAPLAAGTVLALELGGGGLGCVATVRHCREQLPPSDAASPPRSALVRFVHQIFGRPTPTPAPRLRTWKIGCEFNRPLSANDLAVLLHLLLPTLPAHARPAAPAS